MNDEEKYETIVIETAEYVQKIMEEYKLPNLPEVRTALIKMYQKGVDDMTSIAKGIIKEESKN